MATYGNIRVDFIRAIRVQQVINESGLSKNVKQNPKGEIEVLNPDTKRWIQLKTALNYEDDTAVKKIALAYTNAKKQAMPEEGKDTKGLSSRIESIKKQVSVLDDPEQKENAQRVLSSLEKINDPQASAEDKKKIFGSLVDDGLIQRNSNGKKIYLDTQKTGLFYKSLGDKESPANIQKLAIEFGVEDIPKRLRFGIDKKGMTGAKLMGEKPGKMKIEKVDNGVNIDGVEYTKKEIPSIEKMTEIYGNEAEAKKAIESLEKYNKIIESTSKAFEGGAEAPILSPLEDTPPTTPENRKKLKGAMLNTISDGFAKHLGDKKPTKEQQEVLDGLKDLDKIEDQQEWDDRVMELTGKIMKDDFLKTGAADTVELISYARELNKGNMVYLPAASNFPLGDLISMSPEKIDFEKDSPEEIRKKIQLINVGVEKRSIKYGAGGASSSGEKTELSEFKEYNGVSADEVKSDLGQLSNKEKTYKDIFEGDTKKAQEFITETAKKYDIDLEDEDYVKRKNKSIEAAVANIMGKDNVTVKDEDDLRAKLSAYYDMGKTYEKAYNKTVSQQLFTNEMWAYDKKSGKAIANRTDGISSIAYLQFEFNIGWSNSGRPSNTTPTRFKNKDVEDEE